MAKRQQRAEAQSLNIQLGNGEQFYAAVIGVPVEAKGEKEPATPVEEQPQTG